MSVHSWDYVDPKIASRYMTLTSSISSLKKQIKSLEQSNVIKINIKSNLIKKKLQLLNEYIEEYQKYKLDMIDYFDKQTNILTKDVNIPKQQSIELKTISNTNKTKINFELNQSTIQNSKIADNLEQIHKTCKKVKKRGIKGGRTIKNLKRTIKSQNRIIRNFKIKHQNCSESRQKQLNTTQQQIIQQRTILFYKQKSQQNQQLIKLLRTKLQLIQDHYQSRQKLINQYWINRIQSNKGSQSINFTNIDNKTVKHQYNRVK